MSVTSLPFGSLPVREHPRKPEEMIEPKIGNPANTADAVKSKRRSLLARLNAVVTLQVAGLAGIATAFGMWELPVGIGVGGVAALVLAWDLEGNRGK